MKVCSNPDCIHGGKPQMESNFYKHPNGKNRLHSKCRNCVSKLACKWQKDNPKKHSEKSARWAKNNPKKVMEYNKKYESREEVKERKKCYMKEWRKNNPNYQKEYREKNREGLNRKQRIRRKNKLKSQIDTPTKNPKSSAPK
jgi:hypothetical protein